MTDLSMSNPMMTGAPPDEAALADQMMVDHFQEACLTEAWSNDYMLCAMSAPDPFSMKLDCAKLAPASTDHPLKHGGFTVQVERVRGRLKKGGPRHTIFIGHL